MGSLTAGGNWEKIMGEKHAGGLLHAKSPHSTQQVPTLVPFGMGQGTKGGRLVCLSCSYSLGADISMMSVSDFFCLKLTGCHHSSWLQLPQPAGLPVGQPLVQAQPPRKIADAVPPVCGLPLSTDTGKAARCTLESKAESKKGRKREGAGGGWQISVAKLCSLIYCHSSNQVFIIAQPCVRFSLVP